MGVPWMLSLFLTLFLVFFNSVAPYDIHAHPCCQEPGQMNLSLAQIIDAFEIYGHDPTDKLDHLLHYQIEMMKIKKAEDQYIINEHVHIATDHLARFVNLHVKELKVLLIALDDVMDNFLTLFDNHNNIAAERAATYSSGSVPTEFYLSQEYYCGKNVYLFISESYSDIYDMGRGVAPYCQGRVFHFLGFMHVLDETKYYLEEDPTLAFQTDNYLHGLECHNGICIFRFPFKKILQDPGDIPTMPKSIVKCGTVLYKLPPLSAVSCIITSGSFILDFNFQGLRYRHHDYLLTIPNGQTYYTKELYSPIHCDHHVCEWHPNATNFFGGPVVPPGDVPNPSPIPPPWTEPTTEANDFTTHSPQWNITYRIEGCWFVFPPNYGSIAGISYLDPLFIHDYRYTCTGTGNKLGHHQTVNFNVPPPGYVNSTRMSDKGLINGAPNIAPWFDHAYDPGFARSMLPPGLPPQHQVCSSPQTTHPMDQTQIYRDETWRDLHMGPPPPYYHLSPMDSQSGHPIYAGHQISPPQEWTSPGGNFSPSIHAGPLNLLPPPYTPQSFLLSPQFYQRPMFPTTMQYQQHSFIPYPAPAQINPTLNHCNVQFNTPSGAPCPSVSAREFDGTVYYSYDGQGPRMATWPTQQKQLAETRHFKKQHNEEAASKFHNVDKTADFMDATKDTLTVSNLSSNHRSNTRGHWK